jgi:hypothetical protein
LRDSHLDVTGDIPGHLLDTLILIRAYRQRTVDLLVFSPWKYRPSLCHLACPGVPRGLPRGSEAHSDFLLRGPHQRPRVRLSVKESRMKLANATNLDRKSGVAQWRDLCVDALSWKRLSKKRL